MALSMLTRSVALRDGSKMPIIGFGAFQLEDPYNTCLAALQVGYRHIDTAQYYRNEAEVGRAIRDCGIPRDQIYVTTKVIITGFDRAAQSIQDSAKKLNVGAIDLVLLHAPVEGKRLAAWAQLEGLVREGLVRTIGVSNYGVHHLEELLRVCKIPPAVNQIEVHPFFYRKEIVDFCKQNEIVVQAYSPLARSTRFTDKTLVKIAKETGRSPAQVMLRWSLTKVPVTLPKTSNKARMIENADLDFEFSAAQQSELDSLAKANETCIWDPTLWK
jgi:diketogulonate reductase-like aldo/keto reductase